MQNDQENQTSYPATFPTPTISPNPPNFQLKYSKVLYPKAQRHFLNTVMIFPIQVSLNGQEFVINRRYSDILQLRKVLFIQFPVTYLYPAHHQKLIDNQNPMFLQQRTEELNKFFQFVILNQEKYYCRGLDLFFNQQYSQSQISEVLQQYNQFSIPQIYNRFINIKKEPIENDNTLQKTKFMRQFRETNNVNIDFYNTIIRQIRRIKNSQSIEQDSRSLREFLELVIIGFQGQDFHKDLLNILKQIQDFKLKEQWIYLENKMIMLIEDLNVFNEIYSAYDCIEQWVAERTIKRDQLAKEIESVEKSQEQFVGIIFKKNKNMYINELRLEISKCEEELRMGEKFIGELAGYITQNEITNIKNKKKERFDEFIREFSLVRRENLQVENEMWKKLNESKLVYLEAGTEEGKNGQVREDKFQGNRGYLE